VNAHAIELLDEPERTRAIGSFDPQLRFALDALHANWSETVADATGACVGCRHSDAGVGVVAKVVAGAPQHRKLELLLLGAPERTTVACVRASVGWIARAFDANRLVCELAEGDFLEPLVASCGFVREAIYDEALFVDGRRRALVVYGWLRSDAVRASG
jgi:hypothetical protein